MTHPLTSLLLFLAALIAGAINSIAGGGTLPAPWRSSPAP